MEPFSIAPLNLGRRAPRVVDVRDMHLATVSLGWEHPFLGPPDAL